MIKAFLVEDETVIREGLRNSIPWHQYGYELVGDASDGEMALPLIRKYQPDVLITDIKMPFMDGLSLSKIVGEEFPNIKIIIISGYDDFEYARQAIEVGVEQYLLKPITRAKLTKVLDELKEKIEQNQEQFDYQAKYKNEIHVYEQFSRRIFFEEILKGEWTASKIYEEASKLDLEISAASYNLILLNYQEKEGTMKEEELVHYFLRNPQYIVFRLNINSFGILVRADNDKIDQYTAEGVNHIKKICEPMQDKVNWYVAVGKPVERISMLSQCFQKVNKYFAYRFVTPEQHILMEDVVSDSLNETEELNFESVEPSKMNPEIIRDFLEHGSNTEIEDFVEFYYQSIHEALKSRMFRDYVLLNIRFTTIAYVESLGVSQGEFLSQIDDDAFGVENIREYFIMLLKAAIDIRDRQSDDQSGRIIRNALEFIDENYMNESLSLNQVATKVHVSANYFSAIFSQNMKMTFVEYVTKKRMEKAKKLLKNTDTLASEIAQMVGFKDSHYFSFVFKKTQGMSPREYRTGKKN